MTKRARSTFRALRLLAAGSTLLMPPAADGAGAVRLKGYFKSYPAVFRPAPLQGLDIGMPGPSPSVLATNRLRLDFSYDAGSWLSLEGAYDLVPQVQSAGFSPGALLFGSIDPFSYRAGDLDRRLYPRGGEPPDHAAVGQNLDRAALVLHTKSADITIGRQAIAWGSARIVNPTDVLAPFTFETLDTEDRIGVDAVRVRVPLGSLSEIDAGYVFGKGLKIGESAFFGRAKFNALRTDVSFLLLSFRDNLLAGLDVSRSLGGAGFWCEAAYVWADALRGDRGGSRMDYLRASTGLDYSFSARTYGFVEYHFNGAGAGRPEEYLKDLSRPAYTEGATYLMGRQYLSPGATFQLTPLVALTGQLLLNLTDRSAFLGPRVEYNIASNYYLGAGAYIGVGSRPVAGPADAPLLRSEFGSYPNIYYGTFRFYF